MKKYAWRIATSRSSIQFKASYFRISAITGRFSRFSGTVLFGDGFGAPEVNLRIAADSVETYDEHLNSAARGAGFLAPGNYPWIVFTSVDACVQRTGSLLELTGSLQIKERTQPIVFVVSLVRFRKNRKRLIADFALLGQTSLGAFGLFCREEIGDEVRLEASIQLERKR